MKNIMKNFLALASFVAVCLGSAIPMWEYLSKDEKMSHMMKIFAKQVSSHCKNNMEDKYVSQCKRELMVYGLGKLHDMDESHLDVMDPYQRGAPDLIWGSMMDGHASMDNDEQVQNQKPHYKSLGNEKSKIIQKENYPRKNPLFEDRKQSSYDMEMDYHNQYPEHNGNFVQQEEATNVNLNYAPKPNDLDQHVHLEQESNYLSGPMVIRVMPDGSFVDMQIKKDDDREDMMIGRERMPTMHELYHGIKVMDEVPKVIMQMPPTFSPKLQQPARPVPTQNTVKTLYSSYRIGQRNGH